MRFINLVILSCVLIACSSSPKRSDNERYVQGLGWYQQAAEMKALSFQAFNTAKDSLEKMLKKHKGKNPAVVLDVDETILDNSPHAVWGVENNKGYPDGWDEWIATASAQALPGSVEFCQWASKSGVEVFYITNRKIHGYDATLKNMQELGFPVKNENLMLRTDSSSKTERRSNVAKNYNILMFIGDSMTDFSELYEKKSTDQRNQLAADMNQDFGRKFIVLPNPTYGDWEGALYDGNYGLKPSEKTQKIRSQLRSF